MNHAIAGFFLGLAVASACSRWNFAPWGIIVAWVAIALLFVFAGTSPQSWKSN